MENIDQPARFLFNSFLRGELSLPRVLLFVTLRVIPGDTGKIQIPGPITGETLFTHSTMGDVLPRFYNRTVEYGYPDDPDGAQIINRYANIYWDRMEGR